MQARTATVTVLGSGNSNGVPQAGNDWGKCDPAEPRNTRTRPSICIRTEKTCLVIDTGPDFRQQTIREKIGHIDAILYTHAHSDHIDGMNDLRPYWRRQGLAASGAQLPVFGDKQTLDEIQLRFDYLFTSKSPLYPAIVKRETITEHQIGQPMLIGDIPLTLFFQDHGPDSRTLGFRCGDFGYSTDMADIDDNGRQILRGVKNWLADGANYDFPTALVHANKAQLDKLCADIRPEHTWLTHLTLMLDYQTVTAELPANMALAYDGLQIPVKF